MLSVFKPLRGPRKRFSMVMLAILAATTPVRDLFANGEPGAVFMAQKPSEWGSNPDLVTLFQDAAGTTPVTALEQFVGLQLDVRPIFLGPNISALSSQVGVAQGGPAFTNYSLVSPAKVGQRYQITATVSGYAGTGDVGVAGATALWDVSPVGNGGTIAGNGTISFTGTFIASGSVTLYTRSTNTANFSNIVVREVIAAPNALGQPLRGPNISASTASTAGWTPTANASVSSDGTSLTVTNVSSTAEGLASCTTSTTAGAWYEISCDVTQASNGGAVQFGGTRVALNGVGNGKRFILKSDGGSVQFGINTNATGFTLIVRNVSVKLLYGNHRSQATAGARAKISARYNKVTARNANPVDLTGVTFGNAPNALGTLTVVNDAAALAAAGLSVLCTLGNVYKLDNTAGNGQAFINFAGQAGNTNRQTYGAYARFTGAGGGGINLTGGTSPGSSSTTYVRLNESAVPTATTNAMYGYVNAGAVGYFILPDLREACYSYLPTPQVTDPALAIGYDDTGFPARLVYSGAQGYQTGAIDFSGSACAQVFSGTAKLSADTAYGVTVDLSVDPNTNAGSFAHGISTSVGDASRRTWASYLMGTVSTGRAGYLYPSPDIRVHTSLFDLSQATGDTQIGMRLNGGTPSTLSGSTPTSAPTAGQMLGNYPLFYGSRGGTGATNPLTGDEFVSIVRGGATPTVQQLAAVERLIGQRMAYSY